MKKLAFISVIAVLVFLSLLTSQPRGVLAEMSDSLAIFSITPDSGSFNDQTLVVLTGEGFSETTRAYLGEYPLLNLRLIDAQTIEAVVPFGLPEGQYDLKLTDQEEAVLPSAFTVAAGTGGWASDGPYGGRTDAIAIHPEDPDTVFVAAQQSGLFRTTNGGLDWEHVFFSGGSYQGFVEIWEADPDVVYFGGQDGVYRSSLGGEAGSWQKVSLPVDGHSTTSSLAISPSNNNILYCAYAGSVLYSSDGGSNWAARNNGLAQNPVDVVVDAFDPDLVYVTADGESLYRSEDAGLHWVKLSTEFPFVDGQGGIRAISTDPYHSEKLWLGTAHTGLFVSVDAGDTFTNVSSLGTVGEDSIFFSIAFDPNQERIYIGIAGPYDSIYHSEPPYTEWTGHGLNNQGGADVAVAQGHANVIYTTWAGVQKSIDTGENWELLSDGLSAIQIFDAAVFPGDSQRVIAVAFSDGFFGTHNSGNEWISYEAGNAGTYHSVAFDPIVPGTAYIGQTSSIIKTIDDGESFQHIYHFPLEGLPEVVVPKVFAVAVDPQSNLTVYAGVHYGYSGDEYVNMGILYVSDDGGVNWETAQITGQPISRIVFAPSDPDTIYLATGSEDGSFHGEGIWRSVDSGQTWEHVDNILKNEIVMALAVHPDDPQNLIAGVWNGVAQGDGIYYSDDGGDTWEHSLGLGDRDEVRDLAFDPINPQIIYAATNQGLKISFDGGHTWHHYPGPMGILSCTSVEAVLSGERTRLYVATVGGLIEEERAAAQPDTLVEAGLYVGQGTWFFQYLSVFIHD